MVRAGKKKKAKVVWPPAVKIWMDRVDYDLETARAMLKAGRYLYVVFMCQQAVEKTVKAILAFQGQRDQADSQHCKVGRACRHIART